ncbi:carbonic anhydrase 2 [Cannabis sativa]|uniref:carbonic anhydrase 2 n=1 Tax=Cannabis sativa TaxID=3483 RepID=UPI0029CA98AB|nr:carbonic anhydrase 2 [Cannabis sativa]
MRPRIYISPNSIWLQNYIYRLLLLLQFHHFFFLYSTNLYFRAEEYYQFSKRKGKLASKLNIMAEEQFSELANYECGIKKNLVIISEKAESGSESDEDETFDKVQPGHDSVESCFNPVQKIVHGFKHFLSNKFHKYPCLFNELKETQHPKFLVFACSDSRVSPSHILNLQPGEAFMARNIGNLIPIFDKLKHSEVGSIIEYAVQELKVENILVIGHSRCGGVKRLMSHPEDGSATFDFIDNWVNIAQAAKIKVKTEHSDLTFEEQCEICAEEAVNVSLKNLHSYPFVKSGVDEKKIALRGGYYNFVDGSFKLWDLE